MNLSALGLGVGAFGFAMGFALRDILSNFLSGILILGTRHFSVGDQIRIKEYEGTVEAIEMRGTILKTYDGRRVTIPNSEVYTNAVINNTIYTMRRSSIFVGVSYDSDLEMVKELILTALKTVPNVAQQPQPDVLVKELGNYSIQLEIRIWTSAQQIDVLTVNSTATKAIKEALRAGGVQIPFPTQIIIIHDSE
jgi:small-conductance mechanosensitive channel